MVSLRKSKKGFTLNEIILVVLIIAILTAVAVPFALSYIDNAKETSNNNIARTVYVALQAKLSEMKHNGQLRNLATFGTEVEAGSVKVVLEGGHIKTMLNAGSTAVGVLPESIIHNVSGGSQVDDPNDESTNPDSIYYYLKAVKGSNADDSFLMSLMGTISADIRERTLCVEINAGTGTVKSVFYSPEGGDFYYSDNPDDANDEYNLLGKRASSKNIGVYQVKTTGLYEYSKYVPEIYLYDGLYYDAYNDRMTGIPNALYAVAWIPVSMTDDSFTMILTDVQGESGGVTLKTGVSKFETDNITALTLDAAINAPHGETNAILYSTKTAETYINAAGQTVEAVKVIWVIDIVDADGTNMVNSIGYKYPEVGNMQVRANITIFNSTQGVVSDEICNSYFKAYDDATKKATIDSTRHLNNVRYQPDADFTLLNDLDFASIYDPSGPDQTNGSNAIAITNFAPLTWVPDATDENNATLLPDEKVFTGSFDGGGFTIANLTMNVSDYNGEVGLFGTVNGSGKDETGGSETFSVISNFNLMNTTIRAYAGYNVGALAGTATNAVITNVAQTANITIMGSSNNDSCVGGMVGNLNGISSLERSYNGQTYDSTKSGWLAGWSSGFGHILIDKIKDVNGELYLGGLVGALDTGSVVRNCYNNAAVGGAAVDYLITTDGVTDTEYYQSLNAFTDTDIDGYSPADYEKKAIGGIVGYSAGAVENCYNTNYVIDYFYNGADTELEQWAYETYTGGVIGYNVIAYDGDDNPLPDESGSYKNIFALTNNIADVGYPMDFTMLDLAATDEDAGTAQPLAFLTEALNDGADAADVIWQDGNLTAYGSLRKTAGFMDADYYPYPTLKTVPHTTQLEDIEDELILDSLTGELYFDVNGTPISATYDNIHTNFIAVDMWDETADNYIGNLRINVNYKGKTPLYLRVRMDVFIVNGSAVEPGTYQPISLSYLEQTKYNLSMTPENHAQNAWYDNYSNDHCFYMARKLRPATDSGVLSLAFDDGVITGYNKDKYEKHILYVRMELDVAQFNRATALWDISALPWQ